VSAFGEVKTLVAGTLKQDGSAFEFVPIFAGSWLSDIVCRGMKKTRKNLGEVKTVLTNNLHNYGDEGATLNLAYMEA
jgi:hypothetical protein